MLLGAILLALLNPVPATSPADVRAECLKTCAGAPKGATGEVLLHCLQRCEPAAADAGVR
ncbi:MAG: hypothetical protein Q8N23_14985 [Archangium sp.]|nr:hypothetical protein [Archangium sp.]MDP3574251.1 hypothetical protein [Archangium sp.]